MYTCDPIYFDTSLHFNYILTTFYHSQSERIELTWCRVFRASLLVVIIVPCAPERWHEALQKVRGSRDIRWRRALVGIFPRLIVRMMGSWVVCGWFVN